MRAFIQEAPAGDRGDLALYATLSPICSILCDVNDRYIFLSAFLPLHENNVAVKSGLLTETVEPWSVENLPSCHSKV